MKTFLPVLFATVALLTTGCKSMFVSENHRSVTTWETFDDADAAFNKIVVHKTRLNDLKELGFDPHVTPNIKVLNYLDIIERFIQLIHYEGRSSSRRSAMHRVERRLHGL